MSTDSNTADISIAWGPQLRSFEKQRRSSNKSQNMDENDTVTAGNESNGDEHHEHHDEEQYNDGLNGVDVCDADQERFAGPPDDSIDLDTDVVEGSRRKQRLLRKDDCRDDSDEQERDHGEGEEHQGVERRQRSDGAPAAESSAGSLLERILDTRLQRKKKNSGTEEDSRDAYSAFPSFMGRRIRRPTKTALLGQTRTPEVKRTQEPQNSNSDDSDSLVDPELAAATTAPQPGETHQGDGSEVVQGVMRPPLTAEQRLRRPRHDIPQEHPPQFSQERLVEATPVDTQAHRQQHEQRQCAQEQRRLERHQQQQLPRAMTEDEYQEQVRRRQCLKSWYGFGKLVVGLVVLVVVVALSIVLVNLGNDKTQTQPHIDSRKCISTAQELRNIADRLMQLQVERNYTLVQTEIVHVYGEIENWCVRDIQDFSELFSVQRNPRMIVFNRDISAWDMSSATNASYMFLGSNYEIHREEREITKVQSKFNRDISAWNVAHVVDMRGMFHGAVSFNQPLNIWDVSSVTDMNTLFRSADSFNQPLESWNVSGVADMSWMFYHADSFNQPLDPWDVSGVTKMDAMFTHANSFDQSLASWNVSSVTGMSWMFGDAGRFNQPLASWDVSGAVDMSRMFSMAKSFNQPLDSWDVSGVTKMSQLFERAVSFNQPLDSWNVSAAADMSGIFSNAISFDQPLDSWDVSGVTNMSAMFSHAASFDQQLDFWDVSGVTDMNRMFMHTISFNQPLRSWDVSGVVGMTGMFYHASMFNHPMDSWNMSGVSDMRLMFHSAYSFNQSLCTWGQLLPRNATVLNMFLCTSCPITSDPDLSANPPGPFCHPCQ